jgi:UDP-GlcNAc:undecaprenyl-phosphate GlcNAc-1-phosphate transferase
MKAPLFWSVFLGALAATSALTPAVMAWARRIGAVDRAPDARPDRPPTPLLGGLALGLPPIALFAAMSIAGFAAIHGWEWIWRRHRDWLDPLLTLASARRDCATLALGAAAIAGLGAVADARGLRVRYRLAGQIAVALFVFVAGNTVERLSIPGFGVVSFGPVQQGLITVIWVVGLVNAFRLIDGIDGLAAGTAFIISAGLALLSAASGHRFIVLVYASLAGSSLAFLAYNTHPARIYLGACGSWLLGYILAVATLIGAYKTEVAAIVLMPIFALGFPLFESLVSMLRRIVRGKPIFAPDQAHTHHRLLKRGYSERQAAFLLYGVTLLCMVAAVYSQRISDIPGGRWAAIGLYGATLVGVAWLAGYLRPAALRDASSRRRRNLVLAAFTRYASLRLNETAKGALIDEVFEAGRREMGLAFLEIRLSDETAPLVTSGASTAPTESLRARSADGRSLLARYQFDRPAKVDEMQDIGSCLADLMGRLEISRRA